MDCMKALTESTGDFEKSKEFLRKRGLAYAEKRADKLATQGLIGLHSDSNSVSMVQFSCETDFVAKTDNFKLGLEAILNSVHGIKGLNDNLDQSQAEKLKSLQNEVKLLTSLDPEVSSQNIQDGIKFVISKTQENCQLSRVFRTEFDSSKGEVLATYLHNKVNQRVGKIGTVFVSLHFPFLSSNVGAQIR